MLITLNADVPTDGAVTLSWETASAVTSYSLLVIRTGGVPAFTSLDLNPGTTSYQLTGLSRHQRYRFAVVGHAEPDVLTSRWVNVTPRRGLAPRVDEGADGIAAYLAGVERVTVMPQDHRLTAYWRLTRGFVDDVVVEVTRDQEVVHRLSLEPEVTSISLDSGRGVALENGVAYGVSVHARFAGLVSASATVRAAPAPQGSERQLNAPHAGPGLVYPCLVLSPEIRVFEDEAGAEAEAIPDRRIICATCRQPVRWDNYRLVCEGCHAEFIPNGRGSYLDVARLRFGTCRCCLPKKILIQKAGSTSLTCSHSGKEYIRMPGRSGGDRYQLIEDLPYGLCQCCRPRRPLVKRRSQIRCSKSDEQHQNEAGRWVLVPSQPVFDAAAIDDLLDAGMAEICSTTVSRTSRARG